jgi:chromatin remodeling complex protein RSC6
MATAKKAPAKSADTKTAAPAKKRAPNAAFMKALTPSPALAAVVGAAPLPRTEIISKLWVYIKANKLQDAANKRMINADAKLKPVFGKDQVSMFEMAGLIGKHVQ